MKNPLIMSAILMVAVAAYFVFVYLYIKNRRMQKKAIKSVVKKEPMKILRLERNLYKKLNLDPETIKPYVWGARAAVTVAFILVSLKIGVIAFGLAAAVVIFMYTQGIIDQTIERTGIEYLGTLNSFLDSYLSSLSAGRSNDQSMLLGLRKLEEESLFIWWQNRDTGNFELEERWQMIVRVYDVVRFNEEHGIDDSIPIIEQMQSDMNEKELFFNEYKAKMGEINPILASYYLFVPGFMFISLREQPDYWFSIFGFFTVLGLLALFSLSRFMIYKLQANTMKKLF